MLLIKQPFIKRVDGKSRCYCEIYVNDDKKTVWFEVDREYEPFLCTERSDAWLIGLLNYAMRVGHDIKCLTPVTEELLYNINNFLIPSLTKHGKSLKIINIETDIAPTIMEGQEVGTGLSCGIDSFSAIYNNTNTKYIEHNITKLCINNVGAFNDCYSQYGKERVKEERYIISEKVSKELNISLIKTNSNFGDVFNQEHSLTHTYSSCFAIYMLQKLWRVYYYASSGLDYSCFSIIDNDINDCSYYELLSLQCFSTSGLKIYNDGAAKTRLQKTKDIVDYPLVQKYLHVCIWKPYNCSVCPKCKRTLLTLDGLGVLDRFEEAFDIEYFKKNKGDYYLWLLYRHMKRDAINEPVYLLYCKRSDFKKAIPSALIRACFKVIKSRLANGVKN